MKSHGENTGGSRGFMPWAATSDKNTGAKPRIEAMERLAQEIKPEPPRPAAGPLFPVFVDVAELVDAAARLKEPGGGGAAA